MVCRHDPGDHNCSSNKHYVAPYNPPYSPPATPPWTRTTVAVESPDSEKYEVIDFYRNGLNVALKVRYPNCAKCSYEGTKVLVCQGVSEEMIIRWVRIDPHFADKPRGPREAPSPIARFPASDTGWRMAKAMVDGALG
jgi:hypothetical protein